MRHYAHRAWPSPARTEPIGNDEVAAVLPAGLRQTISEAGRGIKGVGAYYQDRERRSVRWKRRVKHQDPYAPSIHAERTRGERLVEQTHLWLEALDTWLGAIGIERLQELLCVSVPLAGGGIHKLVIARHFAHQLKDTGSRRGALYATMAQLLVAATAAKPDGPPRELAALISRLKEIPKLQSAYEHQPEIQTRWQIGDLKFVTRQRE